MFEGKGNAYKSTFDWLDCINMMSGSNVLSTCLEYVSLFLAIILFEVDLLVNMDVASPASR